MWFDVHRRFIHRKYISLKPSNQPFGKSDLLSGNHSVIVRRFIFTLIETTNQKPKTKNSNPKYSHLYFMFKFTVNNNI